jgi:hypothetical protein
VKEKNVLDLEKVLCSYEFNDVLPGSGKKIKLKPITTAQMKKLLSYSGGAEEAETSLDDLITSCVVDPTFDIKDLYLEDRFYLLVALRKKTKGALYSFTYTCRNPKCGAESLQNMDINKMEVKKLGKLDSMVKLDSNFSVQLKYITRGIQVQAQEIVNNLEKIGPPLEGVRKEAEVATLMHALCIEKIFLPGNKEVQPSLDEAIEFLNTIPMGLYEKIRDWFNTITFSIDFKFNVICDVCKQTEKIEVPLESFLF